MHVHGCGTDKDAQLTPGTSLFLALPRGGDGRGGGGGEQMKVRQHTVWIPFELTLTHYQALSTLQRSHERKT